MITPMITSIIHDIVENSMTKWLSIIEYPRSLVMSKVHWCSICDTTRISNCCETHPYDTPTGRHILGWTFCQHCKVYDELLEEYYYKKYVSFIRKRHLRPLREMTFSFYRKPTRDTIHDYIEHHGFYLQNNVDFIVINKANTDIYVSIAWDTYIKRVTMSNILFYNRSIFGYDYNDFPIDNIPLKMIPILHKHYAQCKEWYILDCIFHYHKTNIPMDIQTIIFRFWNNVYIL